MSDRKVIRRLGELLIKISEKDVYKMLLAPPVEEKVPDVDPVGELEEVVSSSSSAVVAPIETPVQQPMLPAVVDDKQRQIEVLQEELSRVRQDKAIANFNFAPVGGKQ